MFLQINLLVEVLNINNLHMEAVLKVVAPKAEAEKAAQIAGMETLEAGYEPLAQPPYQDVYIHYVAAEIAAINADTDAYTNESTLYNNALLTYKNYFNRTHRSLDGGQRWRF